MFQLTLNALLTYPFAKVVGMHLGGDLFGAKLYESYAEPITTMNPWDLAVLLDVYVT